MARVGIIGTGWGARAQTPAFREAGLEVVAISGRRPERTRDTARELGLQPFDDWRALIASDVDLVTIVTPPSDHVEMAIEALDAGKHVVCEKPTALNAGEAERLVAAAKQHPDRIAMIDHELRFLPSFRTARKQIGELGEVWYAEVRYASPNRGDRSRPWNWWNDAQQGGGVWGAVGSHFVDSLRYLVGEIEAVQATLHTFIGERPFESGRREVTADDFAAVHARLRGGALAAMTFSAVAAGPDDPTTLTIHGERAAFLLRSEELLMATRGEPFACIAGADTAKRPGNSAGGAFGTGSFELGRALRAAIDDGDRSALDPAASFEDGLAQQRVLDAARRSSEGDGRWEKA
jgi:predicted dehydrogenase